MKYIILADTNYGFDTPRQLVEINGEKLICRTIRLLKENGVNNIIITSHDKRLDNLGAERYEPKNNYYIPDYSNYKNNKGYWLNAYPEELLTEPITFLLGDVYYSSEAIKTIVKTPTKSTLFFCTYNNQSKKYIKTHDEPLAYKVTDYNLFKKHINAVKKLKDEGKCNREPIVWELYRHINNIDVNKHILTDNCIIINDESCDIDQKSDIIKLRIKIGGIDMIKCEAKEDFNLEKFNELENIKRKNSQKNTVGKLYIGDTFECTKEMADYLLGNNPLERQVVNLVEIKPEEKTEAEEKAEVDEKDIIKPKRKKSNKKKK